MTMDRRTALAASLAFGFVMAAAPPTLAASASEIDAEVRQALSKLYSEVPATRSLVDQSAGVLVFPGIVEGAFVFGGQFGEGALLQGGATTGYYNLVAGSFGFQAGAQSFDMVILFTTEDSLDFFDRTEGFELGVDAGVTIAEVGARGDLTTNSLQDPIVAFVYGERGLMGGVSIEGSKITEIDK